MRNEELYNLYVRQRKWSDDVIQQAIEIIIDQFDLDLSEWQIEETSIFEDTKLCGDLKIFNGKREYMIGHRCRTEEIMEQYPVDVTVRYLNKFGHKTEFAKIMEGKGDFNLYDFHINGNVVRWVLMDLHAFRKAHTYNYMSKKWEAAEPIKFTVESNKHEEDTDFRAYKMTSILEYDKLVDPEDRIIISHSPGYFEDILTHETYLYGKTFISYSMKEKQHRIDQVGK